MILDTLPTAEEFYKTYWGKKPFIVRGYISQDLIESLIDGDTLAGLSLEEDIKSRIITNNKDGNDWVCDHGPFVEDRFADLGDRDWSLLVQNVEQYHTDTAGLLSRFQFSPRWLMDDIMVSFSAPGGSVGPHTDSYHTFLVQGIGKRTWKISTRRVDDDRYVDNPDVKVLAHGFEGETYEVTAGDVIYMPPFFGHEGRTLDAAMTFSVGFLGPKLSEMLGEYAQYLEENEEANTRYLGDGLDENSGGFNIATSTQGDIRNSLIDTINSDEFVIWMAKYFSAPTHDEVDNIDAWPDDGEHVKQAITTSAAGKSYRAIYGEIIGNDDT